MSLLGRGSQCSGSRYLLQHGARAEVNDDVGRTPGADNNYMTRRRWDFFVRHLLGAEPPQEYRIGGKPGG